MHHDKTIQYVDDIAGEDDDDDDDGNGDDDDVMWCGCSFVHRDGLVQFAVCLFKLA